MTELQGEILALLPKLHSTWASAVISTPPLHVGNLPVSVPRATEAVARVREPVQVGVGQCSTRGMRAFPGGSLSWSLWRLGLACRERGCSGCPSPPFTCHLTMMLRFYGGPAIFSKHSWLWRPTLQPLQAVLA